HSSKSTMNCLAAFDAKKVSLQFAPNLLSLTHRLPTVTNSTPRFLSRASAIGQPSTALGIPFLISFSVTVTCTSHLLDNRVPQSVFPNVDTFSCVSWRWEVFDGFHLCTTRISV